MTKKSDKVSFAWRPIPNALESMTKEDGNEEDKLLIESGVLELLLKLALKESPSDDWEKELDEL